MRHDVWEAIVEFRDIFAFSLEELPKISPSVMYHKLDITPGYIPVKQNLHHQGKERIEVAKEKVSKLLKLGFIRVYANIQIGYPMLYL